MAFKPITHALLDVDGLILRAIILNFNQDLYMEVFQSILAPYGKDFTWELKCKVMDIHAREACKIIVEELGLPITPLELEQKSVVKMVQIFPECQEMPGARRLIEHLYSHRIPIGLVTDSHPLSFLLKICHHHDQLFSMFPYRTFGADPEVKWGKPHPEIFLVAARKFPDKPHPDEILVFEDSVNGVRAAKAAGMQVVMCPDPRVEQAHRVEATQVITSLLDFDPELFGLRPFW